MRNVFRAYYRKRHLIGFDKIPDRGPVIFACNHPNSFLDAMIIGAHINREVHFLTRSDVFNSPLKLWILSQFKMIPIYRLQEGVENLDKNKTTFDRCQKIFKAGGAVLIFSEGLCIQELRLRPLKKGTARIALDYSKDGSPLTIIPTGLNYLRATEFRKDLLVKMDTPFNAADFAAGYNENGSRAIIAFNKKLEAGLREVVIDIQDKIHENEIAQLLEIHHTEEPGNLDRLVRSVKELNGASIEGTGEYPELIATLKGYRQSLRALGLDDKAVASATERSLPVLWYVVMPFVMAFYYLAWLAFLIPVRLASAATRKVKRVEFYDSVLLGATGIFFLLYYVFIYTIAAVLFGWKFGLGTMVVAWIVGELAIVAFDAMENFRQQRTLHRAGNDTSAMKQARSRILQLSTSVFNLVKSH